MKEQLWKNIRTVKEKSPLVHNITNYVVMNTTANALLAVGASPVMAHGHSEVKEMTAIAAALVINIGTLEEYWVESMKIAIQKANAANTPWVLDPVGAGATPYRNKVLEELIRHNPTAIRGNASEILALVHNSSDTKGVDSTRQSNEATDAAEELSRLTGAVVCVSGATDFIVHQGKSIGLTNGHPLMGRVTGMGCTASALIGAFCAVKGEDPFEATLSAMALMGIAGEMAAEKSPGPGSLQLHFLDALYAITEEDFQQRLKIKEL